MPKSYGYARISSKDQNECRQTIALLNQGVQKRDIFVDKQSGKDFNRPEYKRLLRKLHQGDTMFIKSIDRLGRNYGEIIDQWRLITKDICADIVVIDMPLLDTRQKELDITGTFISDIVLQILSYFSEFERSQIRQRQREGIAAAKERGIIFGRPPSERPPEFVELQEAWLRQEISARCAAKLLGIHHRTFKLWAMNDLSESTSTAPTISPLVHNG